VCRHFTLNEHLVLPDILLISTPIWNQLGPQEQAWLQQAADESSVFQRALWARQSAEAVEAVKRLGVEVVIPDRKPFVERVAPMYAASEGTAIGELVRFIRELK
jgi:TRAP-type C4-dicarboxylate transport system substrate-binding protein